MSAKKAPEKSAQAIAEEEAAAAYAAGAGQLQSTVSAACVRASQDGLTLHQQANELRAIAQELDNRGRA